MAQVPTAGPSPELSTDPAYSLYAMAETTDWLTAPTTIVLYNGTLIGKSGSISAVTSSQALASGLSQSPNSTVVSGSGLAKSQLQTVTKKTGISSIPKVKG